MVPADQHYQFLLAILPPGAFIGLGFLIAGKMALDRRADARARALSAKSEIQGGSSMNAAKRQLFFQRLAALDPHPVTELAYASPFELLTAVLLSAQATDVGVNKATKRLFPVANTPENPRAGAGNAGILHRHDWPVSQQGQTSAGNLPHFDRAAWQRGAAQSRGA